MEWESRTLAVEHRWRRPRDGSLWKVTFRIVDLGGRAECVGVDIRSWSSDPQAMARPLRTGTLRDLPFAAVLAGAMRDEAQRHASRADLAGDRRNPPWWKGDVEAGDLFARLHHYFARTLDPPAGRKGGRRAKYTFADLQRVAEVYRDEYANGGPRPTPTRHVAEALGISRNQAAKLVARCRQPGVALLSPTEKGKAGGHMPPSFEEEES
jgi:biotin operon repressor